jgi:hypothetical protein
MKSGETDHQAVSLSIQPTSTSGAKAAEDRAPENSGQVTIHFPQPGASAHRHLLIGLAVAPEEIDETIASLNLLSAVSPQVILCHFDPTAGHGDDALAAFGRLQRHYPARYILECIVAADGDLATELAGIARGVKGAALDLSSIAVCPSVDRQSTPPGSAWPPCPPLAEIYAAARSAFPAIPLGGGMFSYFTELNRKRPPVDMLDFVTHCTNPIIHAADDESVMETLETLPHITRTVRAIIGAEKPYHIGPSTIAMRQNPYGSRTFVNPGADRICMAETDPRHFGLFGAAWTIGYAAQISQGAPALYIPASFAGPRGLAVQDQQKDRISPQMQRIPLFYAVRWMVEIAGAQIRSCVSSNPRQVLALSADMAEGNITILANLTAEPTEITLAGPARPSFSTIEILDADVYEPGAGGALTLRRENLCDRSLALGALAIAALRQ